MESSQLFLAIKNTMGVGEQEKNIKNQKKKTTINNELTSIYSLLPLLTQEERGMMCSKH